jgi:hypothetical protein
VSHHQSKKAAAVVDKEIPSEVAISFAHSKYDTNAISIRPPPHCTIAESGMVGYALCQEPPPLELCRLEYLSRGGGAPSG